MKLSTAFIIWTAVTTAVAYLLALAVLLFYTADFFLSLIVPEGGIANQLYTITIDVIKVGIGSFALIAIRAITVR